MRARKSISARLRRKNSQPVAAEMQAADQQEHSDTALGAEQLDYLAKLEVQHQEYLAGWRRLNDPAPTRLRNSQSLQFHFLLPRRLFPPLSLLLLVVLAPTSFSHRLNRFRQLKNQAHIECSHSRLS